MLEFKNVTKSFGSIKALNNLNFKINEGDFVFITGPSGAGKTTLLRLILRDLVPDEGEIILDETDITKLKRKEENAWQQMKEVAVKIYNLKKDELVFQKKKGGWRVASKNQITIAIYDVIGMRYLTNKALELVEEQIKGLLEGYVAEKEANENIGETEEEEEPLANE